MEPIVSLQHWWAGILSYLFFHLVHLLVWNQIRPKKDFIFLGIIFFVIPLFAYGLLANTSPQATGYLAPALLHCLLSAQYLMIYPALQASSPTLQILRLVRLSHNGLTEPAIVRQLQERLVPVDFIDELVSLRFIRKENGSLSITRLGNAVASVVHSYRKCLGLPPGGG